LSFKPSTPRATGPSSNWTTIVERHIAEFRGAKGEKHGWDRNLKTFLGKYWTDHSVGDSEAALIKTSLNFFFPLMETALSNTLPPNPRVTLNARTPVSADQQEQGQTIVNYALQQGAWREELAVIIYNVVMCGRGPVKTTFDFETDLPISRFVDPRNYFFDKTAQRFDDMKYEIEVTLLSKRQMERKVDEGVYPSWALEKRGAEAYPTWLVPGSKEVNSLRDYQSWFVVYEVYDREAGMVFHYLPDDSRPILTDDLIFRPYDLLTFTYNGTDCGGVSELGLIMANQEEYNWTSTFELNRLRFDVPVDYYDARVLSGDKVAQGLQAPLGSKVGVTPHGNHTVSDGFYRPQPPAPHALAQDNLAKQREAMSFVSAMSNSARAQTIGAKTATEMEHIKQQMLDRLGPRIGRIDALTEKVAAKQFFLAQRYMREERVVQLIGDKAWRTVNPFTLEGVNATFDIVAYNPIKKNSAVRLETLRGLVPLVVNNPRVNQAAFLGAIFSDLGMGDAETMLYTDEQMAAMAAAAQPPGAPAQPGAAPPAELAPNPSTPLAPDAPADPNAPGSMPPGGPQP
jgi:hypothetical protein